MSTTSRWIVPSYFFETKHGTAPIEFDLTQYLKTFLSNKVWERKFDYGFGANLKRIDIDEVLSAKVIIYPRFISGFVNEQRIPELIEKACGKFPDHLRVDNYKKWSHHRGFAIIEVKYSTYLTSIPTKKDLTKDFVPHYGEGFLEAYHQTKAVLLELASFFLAGIHISFPTRGHMWTDKTSVYDGIFQIKSKRRMYACEMPTSTYMHEVLIEKEKMQNVVSNFDALANIWHYNLWPLLRFLKAVESDKTSMDNLLDLLFSLEGMFEKNATADFIKTTCLIQLCETKKQAKYMKQILDHAFRIRNQIAHGEKSYTGYEYVKIDGKQQLSEFIYWQMKWIVACMIIKSISKLIQNPKMENLRFTNDDLINGIFK